MITFKQIEAFYWVCQLETFERAAARLNATQSTVSKRIRDLEEALGLPLFDRSQRAARITEKGEQMLCIAEEILELRHRAEGIATVDQPPLRKLRIGITELTALTWLPRFIAALREQFPELLIETQVDLGRELFEGLTEDRLDIAILPDAFADPTFSQVPLAVVENVWMGSPSLVGRGGPVTLAELSSYRLLMQGGRSGSGIWVSRWLRSQGVALSQQFSSDSLVALLGMTVAGLGITYLPRECFAPQISAGKLVVIPTEPALPGIPYVAMFRHDRSRGFIARVAEIASASCDFARQLQE